VTVNPHTSHALLLTAGLGTRLRPLTLVRAKPAIPVAGEPLIRRIIRWLVGNGVVNLTLNLHHMAETVTRVVGDGSDLGARVRYSWEQPTVLGSAGGPRQALDIIGADQFFLINGDTLTDLDLGALANAHASSGALVTLALVPNVEPLRYGGVRLSEDGRVLGFVPRGTAATGTFHFIGAQLAHRTVFSELPSGQPVNSIGGCYDALLARVPGSIRGLVTGANFWDIGTVADYWHTSSAWSQQTEAAPLNSRISSSAIVSRSIIWDAVEIGPGAVLEDCIATDGVQVAAGAKYQRKILMRATGGTMAVMPLEIN
jgi:mannose-1-phosphate guanylyltransferase